MKFGAEVQHCNSPHIFAQDTPVPDDCSLGSTVFERTKYDDKVGLSIEDKLLLEFRDKAMFMDNTNSWVGGTPSILFPLATASKQLRRGAFHLSNTP